MSGNVFSEEAAPKKPGLNGWIKIRHNGEPIPYATVVLKEVNKWSVTDTKGYYCISDIQPGKYTLIASCLGYSTIEREIHIKNSITDYLIQMEMMSLGLNEVLVTTEQNKDDITSSYEIKSDAIEHAQITNIAELMTLMPGGQTAINNNLAEAESSRLTVRSGPGEEDRPDFGTAIEVDGIRLSNNAGFDEGKGVDTRIVSPDNIAKVKVVAGIVSAEHGDLTSGLVKIETIQGVMPLTVKLTSTPRQKQVSFSKGMKLGKNTGVLNLSYDYTNSIINIASPYKSYQRNAYTLRHKKVFLTHADKPLILNTSLAGNIGGYNSESDPDNFKNTYEKEKAFNIRGGVDLQWNIDTRLLSSIDFAANINYSDKQFKSYSKHSSASGTVSFHGTKEGYFVGQPYKEGEAFSPIQIIERGHWYQTTYTDSKPVNYSIKLKLQKNHKNEWVTNNLMAGLNWAGSGNEGKGVYYGNKAHTPDWREHPYYHEPYLNNLALYAEENVRFQINNEQSVKFAGGIRNDYTLVKDSKYGNVSALSPRLNFEYSIKSKSADSYLQKLCCYAGWGESIKLPSFSMLYIKPSYSERMAFVPGSLADGTTYYAYYIQPNEVLNNPSLRWQKSRKFEIGLRGKVKGLQFSLTYFNTSVSNSYTTSRLYIPYTYYLTTPHQLENVNIPAEYRGYSIDQQGTVTVHDNRGMLPDVVLDKKAKPSFKSAKYADNGSPVKRQGLEWVLDFNKIRSLHTSLRLDGAYYNYRFLNKKIMTDYLGDKQLMSDGRPYQYIGYYYGGNGIWNGTESRRLSANATLITHIPSLKLVVTLRMEGSFIKSYQKLSEMPGGERSFEIDRRNRYIPKPDRGSIYEGNNYTGTYPLYYTSFDDMETKIPFREKFLWAYENDKTLYNDLTKMVKTSRYDYLFKKNEITPYFSSNIKVSKEIGQHFKLSFYARNFLNNIAKVKQKQDDREISLLNSSLIPDLSYGISLRIKI